MDQRRQVWDLYRACDEPGRVRLPDGRRHEYPDINGVLCVWLRSVQRVTAALQRAGIPTVDLHDEDGNPVDAVKVDAAKVDAAARSAGGTRSTTTR